MKHPSCGGFTLLEVVIVIAVFAASAAAILRMGNFAAVSLSGSVASVKARALAQDLAERILADRRDPVKSYIYAITATNYPASTVSGLVRSVAITATDAGSGSGLANAHCPDATKAVKCAQVVISVTQSGVKVAEVTFLLVASYSDKVS